MMFASSDLAPVLLAEFSAWDGAKVRNLNFSSAGYQTLPTDTPASVAYMPCLTGNPTLRARIHESFTGESEVSWGFLEIDNSHEHYDEMLDWSFDGRAIALYLGDATWARSSFTRIMSGTVSRLAVLNDGMLRLHIRDRQAELDVPISALEIDDGDQESRLSPVSYGVARNVEPVLVDFAESFLVYRVHDGPVNDIPAAYDRRVPLTQGADYATRALLEGTTPASGGYTTCLAEGLLRVRSLDGRERLTADIEGDNSGGYLTNVAEIAAHIVTTRGGVPASKIDTAAVAAFDAARPYAVGVFAQGNENILDVLHWLFQSVSGWFGFTRDGVFTCGRVSDGPGTSSLELTEYVTEGRLGVEIVDRVAWRVRLGYKHNWTTIDFDALPGSAQTDENKDWSPNPHRFVSAEDATIKTAHVAALDSEQDHTAIDLLADAQAEVDLRLAFDRTHHKIFTCTTNAQPFEVALGDTVTLFDRRYGLAGGVQGRIIGVVERYLEATVVLEILV